MDKVWAKGGDDESSHFINIVEYSTKTLSYQ